MKGFSVISCPWKKADFAVTQKQDMFRFREQSTKEMKPRYQGMMQTIWSGASAFLDEFYGKKPHGIESESECFKVLFTAINSK